MRIVVTGATGNLGTAVLDRLAAEHEIVAIARRPPSSAVAASSVQWSALDLGASDARSRLTDLAGGADVLVHCAWAIQPSWRPALLARTNIGGTSAVLHAVADAGVKTLVAISSVGAYAAGPRDTRVDESWSTAGIETSLYSRHKATVERMLDGFEVRHPEVAVARLRPALMFRRDAAGGVLRYFAAPLPRALVGHPPVLPLDSALVLQAVHPSDVARAVQACLPGVHGAFNLAADPVLEPARLADLFGARQVPVPVAVLRAGLAASWHLRLQPLDPGWIDMGAQVPLMSSERAHRELGWEPQVSAERAAADLIDGLRSGAGESFPASRPTDSLVTAARRLVTEGPIGYRTLT